MIPSMTGKRSLHRVAARSTAATETEDEGFAKKAERVYAGRFREGQHLLRSASRRQMSVRTAFNV